MRRDRILALASLVGVALLLAGCGQAGHKAPPGTMVMPDGSTMSAAQMKDMQAAGSASGKGGSATRPSATAALICSPEIQNAVRHTFELGAVPAHTSVDANHTFTCTYHLTGGDLVMSVKDLTPATGGMAYFRQLRTRLPGATTIKGVQSLGFPAFETAGGDVAFIKDGKTLWVDGSGLAVKALPKGITRTDAAYGVAAAVLACWNG